MRAATAALVGATATAALAAGVALLLPPRSAEVELPQVADSSQPHAEEVRVQQRPSPIAQIEVPSATTATRRAQAVGGAGNVEPAQAGGTPPVDAIEPGPSMQARAADAAASPSNSVAAVAVARATDDVGAREMVEVSSPSAAAPAEGSEAATGQVLAAQGGPACGPVTCPGDMICCNESCGICTPPGTACSQRTCGMPMTLSSTTCGPVTCATGQICCDPYCGRCIDPGEKCEPAECLSPVVVPRAETCGSVTCNAGYVCCNPSCGICTRPGEPCTRQVC